MKRIITVGLLLLSTVVKAQNITLTMSEDVKLNRSGATFNTLLLDDQYMYLAETHTKTGTNIIGTVAMSLTEVNLLKLDNNYNKVLERSYDNELKRKSFHSIQVLGEELYLFATVTSRDELQITVYGAKLDKNDGSVSGGELTELASFERDDKKDPFWLQISTLKAENDFLISAMPASRQLKLQLFDKALKRKEKLFVQLPYQEYSIMDFKLSSTGQILVLQRGYAPIEPGSKHNEVVKYALTVYSRSGNKEREFVMEQANCHLINAELAEGPNNEWVMAGLYASDYKHTSTVGYFVCKANVVTGEIKLSTFNPLQSGMITNAPTGVASKKDKGDPNTGLNGRLVLKELKIDPSDGGILLMAEDTWSGIVLGEKSTMGGNNRYEEYENLDLLLLRLSSTGKLQWASLIHKAQKEKYLVSFGGYGADITLANRSKMPPSGGGEVIAPYYSSYKTAIMGKKMLLLLNDDKENQDNPVPGIKMKPVQPAGKNTALYAIWVDLDNGKMTRQLLTEGDGDRTAYIRFAILHKNQLLIPFGNKGIGRGGRLSFGRMLLPKN